MTRFGRARRVCRKWLRRSSKMLESDLTVLRFSPTPKPFSANAAQQQYASIAQSRARTTATAFKPKLWTCAAASPAMKTEEMLLRSAKTAVCRVSTPRGPRMGAGLVRELNEQGIATQPKSDRKGITRSGLCRRPVVKRLKRPWDARPPRPRRAVPPCGRPGYPCPIVSGSYSQCYRWRSRRAQPR